MLCHFSLDEEGKATGIKMKGISPNMDFSFDFHEFDLKRYQISGHCSLNIVGRNGIHLYLQWYIFNKRVARTRKEYRYNTLL